MCRFKAHSLKMLARLGTTRLAAVYSTAAGGMLALPSLQPGIALQDYA